MLLLGVGGTIAAARESITRHVVSPHGIIADLDVMDSGDDDDDAILSHQCAHIKRRDVNFLLPHVQHMLTPTGTNASWRSLFNMAPPRSWSPQHETRRQRKVFGIGLSKTGVTSLRFALLKLGWKRHAAMDLDFYSDVVDTAILNGVHPNHSTPAKAVASSLRKHLEHVDASTDLPLALFPDWLYTAFPEALFVLTTRGPIEWWASARKQMDTPFDFSHPIGRNRAVAYGNTRANAALYTSRYISHNVAALRSVPCERLLLLDIINRADIDGWRKLSSFLGVDPPESAVPFPNSKPMPTPRDAPETTMKARPHGASSVPQSNKNKRKTKSKA